MNETLDRKDRKAMKEHRCDLCGDWIRKGELYHWQKSIYDGTIYEWHEHMNCSEVCGAIWDYVDPDEGMDEDQFQDGCQEISQIFICPDCPKYNKEYEECEDDETFCIGRMAEFFKTHELFREGRDKYGREIWKCREKEKKNALIREENT